MNCIINVPEELQPNPSPMPKSQNMATIQEETENQEIQRTVNITDKSEQSLLIDFTKTDIISKEDKINSKNTITTIQQIVQVKINH